MAEQKQVQKPKQPSKKTDQPIRQEYFDSDIRKAKQASKGNVKRS